MTVEALPWCWKPTKRRVPIEHEFFEEGNIKCSLELKQIILTDEDFKDVDEKKFERFPCAIKGCVATFDTIIGYECHYNNNHRHTCSQCKRSFPTSHLVNIHIAEWHDSMFPLLAAKQNMYECLLEACQSKFATPAERKQHLIDAHKYPVNFRFDKGRRKSKSKRKISPKMTAPDPVGPDKMDTVETQPEASIDQRLKNNSYDHMVVDQTVKTSPSKFKFSYSVPKTICFGQGVRRGFQRPPKKKGRKHWHQTAAPNEETKKNIEDIDFSDIAKTMDTL
ncbi:zinc finger protein 511-like [Tubulanus polymorphus]|uniref:zinc finger protein 511-like n=1 Tax=Tubulanus polymorphus TaxID=672921 RepID=UPI003DA609EB